MQGDTFNLTAVVLFTTQHLSRLWCQTEFEIENKGLLAQTVKLIEEIKMSNDFHPVYEYLTELDSVKQEVIENFLSTLKSTNSQAFIVQRESNDEARPNECYSSCLRYSQRFGGELVLGWMVSTFKSYTIQLTGHAVIRDNTGRYRCVSQGTFPVQRFLFIIDSSLLTVVDKQNYLPRHTIGLVDSKAVRDIIYLEDRHEQYRQMLFSPTKRNEYELNLIEYQRQKILSILVSAYRKLI